MVLLTAPHYIWCWSTGRWYILSSFRFFPGVTLTFSKYILWYERWQWSLLPLNLFPWHQETDISVSIWFWLQASGRYSRKMRVLCLTPSIARLQSFSRLNSLHLARSLLKFACCNCVHLVLFNSSIISVATIFMGDHGRRLSNELISSWRKRTFLAFLSCGNPHENSHSNNPHSIYFAMFSNI